MESGSDAGAGMPGLVDRRTGLASDYVNQLAGVAMLVELLPAKPDLADDVLAWAPVAYGDYFARSPLSTAADALQAFAAVDEGTKERLRGLVCRFDSAVTALQGALRREPGEAAMRQAALAAPGLAALVAELAALVNGSGERARLAAA